MQHYQSPEERRSQLGPIHELRRSVKEGRVDVRKLKGLGGRPVMDEPEPGHRHTLSCPEASPGAARRGCARRCWALMLDESRIVNRELAFLSSRRVRISQDSRLPNLSLEICGAVVQGKHAKARDEHCRCPYGSAPGMDLVIPDAEEDLEMRHALSYGRQRRRVSFTAHPSSR